MLKVGSIYPARKRVSATLIPEYAALSETIGWVWAWGNHTISTAIAAARRDCTESSLWPGRAL